MHRAKSGTFQARIAGALDRPIVLVGLMGAGKSSIGRLLAAQLGLEFVDADSEIERAAGATIEEIFDTHGEAFFRSGERRVIARLLGGPVQVIATGGGAFVDPETRRKIKAAGLSIWLKADTETLLKRVSRRGGRPLLKGGDPRQVMADLAALRYPTYAEADITVETSENPPAEVTERVIVAIAKHLGIKTSSRTAANTPNDRPASRPPARTRRKGVRNRRRPARAGAGSGPKSEDR